MPKQPKHLAVENKSPCASHCHQPSTAPKETDRCGLCKLPTSCRPEKHLDGQTTSRQAQNFGSYVSPAPAVELLAPLALAAAFFFLLQPPPPPDPASSPWTAPELLDPRPISSLKRRACF